MNLLQQLQQVGQDVKAGYKTADVAQRQMFAAAKKKVLAMEKVF